MAYHLTVNIESMGTATSTGPSTIGHMWYSLDDGSGNPPSNYGFAPVDGAEGQDRIHGDGEIFKRDNNYYAGDPAYYRTIEITKEQYDAMKKFGDDAAAGLNPNYQIYDVKNSNCIDFVFSALTAGGLNPKGVEGNWIPMGNAWKIDWLLCGRFPIKGNGYCSANFNSAQNFIYRSDPLTLDLDGDGIETLAASSTNPVMFDYNGDGTKTSTGWIKSDDGMLVLDRNSNGTIDNASELFSDYTPLTTGGNSANGFAALSQEDTNNDGVVNNLRSGIGSGIGSGLEI